MPRAFVIRPFNTKRDRDGIERDFERVYTNLIVPALNAVGIAGGDAGKVVEAGNIRQDMFRLIFEADLVLCDVTLDNANVFYELGIRHALRRGRTILLRAGQVKGATPFDILTDRHLKYDIDKPESSVAALVEVIQATLNKEQDDDSPVFTYIPELSEALQAATTELPQELTEEIDRACGSKMPGWLRLLESEVSNLSFEWPALRAIGRGLWRLKDTEGARRCWERVREQFKDDVEANLALANLYERTFRDDGQIGHLVDSDAALERVLAVKNLHREKRAEALALHARNIKTRWRVSWQGAPVERRRAAALSDKMLSAYDNYRRGFAADLNHYWSGLAALQMGTIALDLAREPAWRTLFRNPAKANDRVQSLEEELQKLSVAVSLAIEACRAANGEKLDLWAEISDIDLRFLSEDNADVLARAYLDTIPDNEVFAWDSARGQLAMFAELGVRGPLATDVIAKVDAARRTPRASAEPSIIVFVGHRVDEPGRARARFPATAEDRARQEIRAKLSGLAASSPPIKVLASAAPGADILCHEICIELGIDSVICLPMPKDELGRYAYGSSDPWRNRYLSVLEKRPILQLSDQKGLPRWLRGTLKDPWHRGNRWVLEMARTSSRRVTVVALWDGEPGTAPGGTADMVQMARDAVVDVVTIDTKQLLLP